MSSDLPLESAEVTGRVLAAPEAGKQLERAQTIALAHFEHVERQVQLAATKASLIVAADALMLNAYLKVITDYEVFTALGRIPLRWFSLGGGLLVVGFVTALLAVFPKTWGGGGIDNVLFYGSIARSNQQVYINSFWSNACAGKLDDALLLQIHGKSGWLRKMFMLTSISIISIIAGTCICAVVLGEHVNTLPGLGIHR
jgi:hypothetical protein